MEEVGNTLLEVMTWCEEMHKMVMAHDVKEFPQHYVAYAKGRDKWIAVSQACEYEKHV